MLTNQQIITLACTVAKCPGFTTLAGQLYNTILDELCQTYDFDIARVTYAFNFNLALGGGKGPFPLPADYLRVRKDDFFYTIDGVPYFPVSYDLSEFDALVITAGFQSYPTVFATDMSTTPPGLYVWPPASGAYAATMRYQRQMPTIANPETSGAAPWFPNAQYLKQRLTGELCQLTGDDRAEAFLSDNEDAHPMGAGVILRKLLRMQGDPEGRAKTVTLDRRRFGGDWSKLKNTKLVGW